MCFFYGCAYNNYEVYKEFFDKRPNLTYDQSISVFGKPTSITQGNDVYVVIWDKQKPTLISTEQTVSTGAKVTKGHGPTYITPGYTAVQVKSDMMVGEKLTIIFKKSNNIMIHWQLCEDF
jgi:hypothetical protein